VRSQKNLNAVIIALYDIDIPINIDKTRLRVTKKKLFIGVMNSFSGRCRVLFNLCSDAPS
jgi:hypothetical protein